MAIMIQTYYISFYHSNSQRRQQLGLKRNFAGRGAQIIGSEIIQTDDKMFPHFLRYILDILLKLYETLKKFFET